MRLHSNAVHFSSCFRRNAALWVAVVFGISGTVRISAATTLWRWTGGSSTSGNWSSGANWLGGVAPTGGDQRLIFENGAGRKVNTNNLPAGTTFESVWVVDDGYNIYGNSVRIDYLRARCPAGTSTTFRPDIIATGDLQIIVETNNSTFNVLGDVSLTADDLYFPATGLGDVVMGGVISGTGNIRKQNPAGEVSFSGFGANTYVGTTYVSGGVLRLSRYTLSGGLVLVGATAIPGDLVIGDFVSTLVADIVVLDRDNQIANTSKVAVNATGSLELSDENDTIGELRLYGGMVSTGTGSLAVEGTIFGFVPLNVSKDSVIAGRLLLGSRGDGPQFIDVAQGVQLNITAQISGVASADLIKTNRGELVLSSSNLFSGDVEIKGGTVTITDRRALGTTNGVTKAALGVLNIIGTIGIPESLVVVGPSGLLDVGSGNPSWLGRVILDDDLLIHTPTNCFLSIVGEISGPAGWTKYGDGTLQFKTPYTNTYAGQSWVREGKMILDGVFNQAVISGPFVIGDGAHPAGSARVWPIKQHQIGDTVPVTLNRSGILQLGGLNDTVGSLTFNGGAVETSSGTLTLNGDILANATNQTATISGKLSLGGATRTIHTLGTQSSPDLLISAVISDGGAAAGLNKVGEGTLVLSGANTYTGESALSEGRLIVDGSIAASLRLNLNQPLFPNSWPAILGGQGTVPRIYSYAGGILAPGSSPGRLTVQGDLALSNDVVRVELNGTTPGASYDQLRVNGLVKLGNSLLELTLGFTPPMDASFMLIQNDGTDPVQGTFAGLPQGSYFSAGGMTFSIEYNGGDDDNDVVITRVATPSSNISSLTPQNGKMVIQGQGLPGLDYVLQFSPHLNAPIPWMSIATNHADALGIYEFVEVYADGGATLYPARFYRVLSK